MAGNDVDATTSNNITVPLANGTRTVSIANETESGVLDNTLTASLQSQEVVWMYVVTTLRNFMSHLESNILQQKMPSPGPSPDAEWDGELHLVGEWRVPRLRLPPSAATAHRTTTALHSPILLHRV